MTVSLCLWHGIDNLWAMTCTAILHTTKLISIRWWERIFYNSEKKNRSIHLTKLVFSLFSPSIAYPKWTHFSFIQFDTSFSCVVVLLAYHNKLIRKIFNFAARILLQRFISYTLSPLWLCCECVMQRNDDYLWEETKLLPSHTVHYFNGLWL